MKSLEHAKSIALLVLSALMIAITCGCKECVIQPEQTKPVEKPAPEAGKPGPEAIKIAQAAGTEKAAVKEKTEPAAPLPKETLKPSTVLVKVDDATITQGDVDIEMANMKVMMANRGISDEQVDSMMSELKPQIIEGLITKALLEKECEDNKIKVSDSEVTKEIDMVKANLPEKLSLEDILEQSGLTQKMFEQDIKEQLKLEKLLEITKPTDKEIKAYYEKNKVKYFDIPETVLVRHILIATKATDDDAAKAAKKQKAENLRKQLLEGADFEKLAKENSECPSRQMGGKLPPFGRGQMVAEFEESGFSMKTNEISSVVETEFGFHIINKLKHNEAKTLKYDEVKDRIATMIKGRKLQEKASSFIQDLRKKAKITYVHGAPPTDRMMFPMGMPAPAPSPPKPNN